MSASGGVPASGRLPAGNAFGARSTYKTLPAGTLLLSNNQKWILGIDTAMNKIVSSQPLKALPGKGIALAVNERDASVWWVTDEKNPYQYPVLSLGDHGISTGGNRLDPSSKRVLLGDGGEVQIGDGIGAKRRLVWSGPAPKRTDANGRTLRPGVALEVTEEPANNEDLNLDGAEFEDGFPDDAKPEVEGEDWENDAFPEEN
ncbi:hypothetical protein BKA63DRAFT_567781 [Paraphoma chrysanthemicola]|nr:hypothetical protein BKA63DRAFT_567781 [Paraphoma chrysanthemicola]